MRSMRRLAGLALLSLGGLLGPMAGHAAAQDGATLDQTRKMYQDALSQLKAAQDRKNELASENAKLHTRVAELEKQAEIDQQFRVGEAERTYLLRARLAAWEAFMKQNPATFERWRAWLGADAHPGGLWQLGDWDWPFKSNAE